MARIAQDLRDTKGRYIKLTIALKIKRICNRIMVSIEQWINRVDR